MVLLLWNSYVPYKYALEKFVNVGSISKDHIDPSIFCVLTAKSKTPGSPLADFLIFSPRWDVADGTFRPPVSSFDCLFNLYPLKTLLNVVLCVSTTIEMRRRNLWV